MDVGRTARPRQPCPGLTAATHQPMGGQDGKVTGPPVCVPGPGLCGESRRPSRPWCSPRQGVGRERGLVRVPGAKTPPQPWLVPVETPLWMGGVMVSISRQRCRPQRGCVNRAGWGLPTAGAPLRPLLPEGPLGGGGPEGICFLTLVKFRHWGEGSSEGHRRRESRGTGFRLASQRRGMLRRKPSEGLSVASVFSHDCWVSQGEGCVARTSRRRPIRVPLRAPAGGRTRLGD